MLIHTYTHAYIHIHKPIYNVHDCFLTKFTCSESCQTPLTAVCSRVARRRQALPTAGGWTTGNNLPCLPSAWTLSDWLGIWTNRVLTSRFSTTNHLASIRTHNLRRNQGRLSRLRSIEIWQLHRWDNRPETASLYISVFPPEHYSLWAWGCYSQKTTIRSQPIPAAWVKRKRTGRLRKVGLFWREWGYHHLNGRQHAFIHAIRLTAALSSPQCCDSRHFTLWTPR